MEKDFFAKIEKIDKIDKIKQSIISNNYTANTNTEQEEIIDDILEEAKLHVDNIQMAKTAETFKEKNTYDEVFNASKRNLRFTNHKQSQETEIEIPETANLPADETASVDFQLEPEPKNKSIPNPRLAIPKPHVVSEPAFDISKESKAEEIRSIFAQKATVKDINSIDVSLSDDEPEESYNPGELEESYSADESEESYNPDEPEEDYESDEPDKSDEITEDSTSKSLNDFKANNINTEEENTSNFEKLFGRPKLVSAKASPALNKIPIYKHESKIEKIIVKAGKFSQMVEYEYEEYMKSKNPAIVQTIDHSASAPPSTKSTEEEELTSAEIITDGAFHNSEIPDAFVEDFEDIEDSKSVLFDLNSNIRKLFIRSIATGMISLFFIPFTILQMVMPMGIFGVAESAPVLYSVINFLAVAITILSSYITIISGLIPLSKLKGNSDTALAVASLITLAQSITAIFVPEPFYSKNLSLFSVIVIIAFFLNSSGKLLIIHRVKNNFKFIMDKGPKFSAKIYSHEENAVKLMGNASVGRPIMAYQHRTFFLSNFLKISYTPDLSENVSAMAAPVTTICSIIIVALYAIFYNDFPHIITAFSLFTVISIPISNLISTNIPMRKLNKKLLSNNTMLSGYPAIEQFCNCNAVMLDAHDLYPKDSIVLDGIKTFVSAQVDQSMLEAAAILKKADSPLLAIFSSVLEDKKQILPYVESVTYEDKLGLVGWVAGNRILIGSRTLMKKYGVSIPAESYEEKYKNNKKQVAYLAKNGQLIALFVTLYNVNPAIYKEVNQAYNNGLSLIISTSDHNVTAEKISEDFNIFYRSVRVLNAPLGQLCRESFNQREEMSRAYLSTRGNIISFLGGISSCISIKSNMFLSVVIQMIFLGIGFLISTSVSLYMGVESINSLYLLLYIMFSILLSIIIPIIRKI